MVTEIKTYFPLLDKMGFFFTVISVEVDSYEINFVLFLFNVFSYFLASAVVYFTLLFIICFVILCS